MERSRRRDSSSPPVLADLTATQGWENELSLSDSDSNSSLTVETSKGRLHPIEESTKDCLTAWTDEKHGLYLDHLESSFVDQLHRSIGILSWCSDDGSKSRYSSRKLIAKTRNTSEQFEMIQDDCADSIDLKRKRHHRFAEFSDQNFAVEANEQTCRKKQAKTILSGV